LYTVFVRFVYFWLYNGWLRRSQTSKHDCETRRRARLVRLLASCHESTRDESSRATAVRHRPHGSPVRHWRETSRPVARSRRSKISPPGPSNTSA
jgi:hypothetical protein